MKSNSLFILGPIVVLADLLAISPVTSLLSAEDRAQIMVAVVLSCLLLSVNIIFVRTLFLKLWK